MNNKILTLVSISLTLLLLAAPSANAQNAAEMSKIQYLIKSVEDLQGVKFIRNGSEYDSARAAEHLRFKLNKAGDRVKTAEDFIRLCSTSYLSGKPYKMLYPDGSTISAEGFFRQQLKLYK